MTRPSFPVSIRPRGNVSKGKTCWGIGCTGNDIFITVANGTTAYFNIYVATFEIGNGSVVSIIACIVRTHRSIV